MATIAVWLKIDEERVVQALARGRGNTGQRRGRTASGFLFHAQDRFSALRAMEEFAGIADGKGVKVVLRGVNVDVYRVFKLVKLVSRFSFVT